MHTGGALSQARGALSSWWNTLTTAHSPEGEASAPVTVAEEAKDEDNSDHNSRQDDSVDGCQQNVEKLESGELMVSPFTDSSTKMGCVVT